MPHILTSEDKSRIKQLQGYSNNPERSANIRKWDHSFTGYLTLQIQTGYHEVRGTFRESEKSGLEEKLGEIFTAICKAAACMRAERIAIQNQERKHVKEHQLLQQNAEKYNEEIDKLTRVIYESERYRLAGALRAYAEAISSSSNFHCENKLNSAEYAAWIQSKADWIDPLVQKEDEVFGAIESEGFPPEKKEVPPYCIPYEVEDFHRRHGQEPGKSWEEFAKLTE